MYKFYKCLFYSVSQAYPKLREFDTTTVPSFKSLGYLHIKLD